MTRAVLIAIAAVTPGAAMAEAGIDGSDIRFLGYVAAVVGAAAAILLGNRSFVKSEIREHAEDEEAKATLRHQALLDRIDARDQSIAGRIDALTQRLEDRGVFASRSSSGSWTLP